MDNQNLFIIFLINFSIIHQKNPLEEVRSWHEARLLLPEDG